MPNIMAEPFQGRDTQTGKEIVNFQGALDILNQRAKDEGLDIEFTYARLQGMARTNKVEIVKQTGRNAFYDVEDLNQVELTSTSQVGKRGNPIPAEVRDRAISLAASGKSYVEIAQMVSTPDRPIARQIVQSWVTKAQDAIRGDNRKRDLVAKIVPLYRDLGLTLKQVSDSVKNVVSPGTIRNWLLEAGVEIRPTPVRKKEPADGKE